MASWQQRSRKTRRLVIILPIVMLCAIVVITVAVVVSKKAENNKRIEEENKKIHKRQQAAESIKSAMDETVDPCEDFYTFTCGNFGSGHDEEEEVSRTTLLQNEIYRNLKDEIDKKAKQRNLPPSQKKLVDAYLSCRSLSDDDIKVTELRNFLIEIGGWPMGDDTWDENSYDIGVAMATAFRMAGMSPLVKFFVLPDMKNTTRNIITLQSPDDIDIALNEFNEVLMPIAKLSPSFSNEIYADDMNQLMSLGKDLDEIKTISDDPEEYHQFQIKELKTKIKGVDFIKYFQVITNNSLNDMNQYLTEDDYVAVADLKYLQKLTELVQSSTYSMRVYANYIGARIILEATMLVKSVVEPSGYSFPRQKSKHSKTQENWNVCLSILVERLTSVIDRVYIDSTEHSSKGTEKALQMIDFIKKAFKTLTKEADWLDKDTLSKAVEKLHAMRKNVGYPSWIMDDEKLEDYYRTLPDMGDGFGQNLKKISGFVMDKTLKQLRMVNDLNEWPQIISTTTVNAFYVVPFNSIYFPLAIQNYPFYDPDIPWYLNFGAIGSVIGHEITHGFDSQGRKADKNGNIKDWWGEEASERFNRKAECFVEQYDGFDIPEIEESVNGRLTLAENIADNGGLRQAYLAYQNWVKIFGKEQPLPGLEKYTPEQLLFISFSSSWCETSNPKELAENLEDEHTPLPYRIWGTISNSREFAKTFNCTAGDRMNPEEKCIIW